MRSWTTFKTAIGSSSSSSNSWNTLQDKPAILSDNQVSWDEIQNSPIIESGSFSPKMYGIVSKTFYHYKNRGKYIRIDNAYFFSIYLEVALSNQNGSEMLEIRDIPFTFPEPQDTPVYIPGTYNSTTNNLIPYLYGIGGFSIIRIGYIYGTSFTSSLLLANMLRTSGTFYLACNGSFFV